MYFGLKFDCLTVSLKFYYMATQPKDIKKDDKNTKPALKPDPETLHTTDPQDHMKGPVSSVVHNIKDEAEKNDKESKSEADQKK